MPGRAPKRHKSPADDPLPTTAEAAAPVELPPSWSKELAPEFAKPYFANLVRFVAAERAQYEVYPPEDDVYNAFTHTPLDKVRVVILGQDPYPNPGQGHGLCFSVRPGVAIPGSLRNIFKELNADLGIPPARHGYLVSWADQGVLLLNAVLTVRAGKPASHAGKGWETFTDAALAAVGKKSEPVVFLLWGAYAQKKAALIDTSRHVVLKAAHPSPLSAKNGFFGSRPFSQANAALEKAGRKPIDWRLPEHPAEAD